MIFQGGQPHFKHADTLETITDWATILFNSAASITFEFLASGKLCIAHHGIEVGVCFDYKFYKE